MANCEEPRVFISHGHNQVVALKLRQFIAERLNAQPVILSEQPDEGMTIIEKLEKYGKGCDFALILLTADDQTAKGGIRARQNVIHELGFFHGALGRDKVLLIKQAGVELFSNISGLIYKEFQGTSVESISEDIRQMLSMGSASIRGETVPADPELGKQVMEEIDKICEKDIQQVWRRKLHSEMKEILSGLPDGLKLKRLRRFFEERRIHWNDSHKQQMEIFSRESNKTKEDPENIGSFAILAKIFTSADPSQMVEFIKQLEEELLFCQEEGMDEQGTIRRLETRFPEPEMETNNEITD